MYKTLCERCDADSFFEKENEKHEGQKTRLIRKLFANSKFLTELDV